MHRETETFYKLNELKYDSLNPNFIKIESLIISLLQIDEVLDYCKEAYKIDSDVINIMYKFGKEQAVINGMGLLQILYYQQNCINELYQNFTNNRLKFPEEIIEIRKVRNAVIGHPDDRGLIPIFDFSGCSAYQFDEGKEYNKSIYYEEIISIQQRYINSILNKLILITNK